MTATALVHRDAIIEQVRAGKRLIDISRSLGLTSHAAISLYLADDPEYRLAREIGAQTRMELREEQLEKAKTSLTVARARELLSHARWRAEREFPHKWGPKQEVTHSGATVHLNFTAPQLPQRTTQIIEQEKNELTDES
jgi:hypothetical protein